jgi:Fe-S-cluster containining protein
MIYAEELNKAKLELPETKKKMQQLGKKNHRDLDKLFHEAHEQVFRKIDCLSCANCCKTTSPIFRDVDIKRIAKKQRVSESAFIQQYLRMDEDSDYVLKSSPCTFLGTDNKCSIYEDRPLACREYPHTDRKNMHQILSLTTTNSLICPAVVRVISNIQEKKR